jgi:hypothetical protein
LVFFAISGLLMATVLLLGPYPITKYPRDTAYMLVQADYLVKGYRPYIDYNSMHGPFAFLFPAVGMMVHGVSMQSIILAQVLGASLFGLLMFKMAINRVHAFWAVLLAVSVELILLSCTPIGSRAWREFTCAMWYNAIGYSIQSIIFLYLLVPSRSSSQFSRWVDTGIVAFCLAACLLTKMSFFIPTVVLFVFGAVVWPREREMRLHGIVVILLAILVVLGIMGSLSGSLASYWNFLDAMQFKANPLFMVLRFLQYTRTIGVFLLGMLLVSWMAHEVGMIKELRREWVLALLMFGTLLLSASTASQDQEILPMLGVVPLGVSALIATLAKRDGRRLNLQLAAPALIIALLLVTHAPKNGALSLVFSHLTVPVLSDPIQHYSRREIDAMELNLPSRVDPDVFTSMPKTWVDQQLAALKLLDEAATDDERVIFVATATSPIALLSDYQNALGQAAWWPHVFAAAAEDFPLLDSHLLEDTDWILRDLEDTYCWSYLKHHRGEFIDKNFELVAENEYWELYGRRASAQSTQTH